MTGATRIGRFAQVAQTFTSEYGFSRLNSRGKYLGQSALLIDDRVFAWSSVVRYVVVRLPTERVDALVSAGAGRALAAGGRQTPDWLVVHASPSTSGKNSRTRRCASCEGLSKFNSTLKPDKAMQKERGQLRDP